MVLVFDKPSSYIGLLQTKLSHREGHESGRIGLEAVPLDQHIEGRHGERQSGVEILPHAVRDPLEMADHSQPGEHRLYQHAVLPLAAQTQFQVAGIAFGGMEGGITENDHLFFELSHQPLEGVICNIRGGTVPPNYQTVLVQ